jgi:hypothetical protein
MFAPPSNQVTLGRVAGEVGSLYGGVDSADAAPTTAQVAAMTTVDHDFSSVMARWRALTQTDLPALNRQLRAAGVPELRLKAIQ